MTTDLAMDTSDVNIPQRPAKIARLCAKDSGFEDLSSVYFEQAFGQVDFERQYASAYFIRLEMLRKDIMSAARARWVDSGRIPESFLVGNVKSYKSNGEDIALVGVLFKDMALKPKVLCDIQNSLGIADQFMNIDSVAEVTKKLSDTDVIFLEDTEARLQLVFDDVSLAQSLPTGVVVGVLGKINAQGFFHVHDLTLPGCPVPQPFTPASNQPAEYVAIVSGLQIGSVKSNPLALQLLKDFIMGVGLSEQDRLVSSSISRLIIAGDTLVFTPERDPTSHALAEADVFLAELASVVPVDLMSGPRDPVNYCLPQQPLHSGLLPEARRYGNLHVRTNPYKAKIGNLVFLGTSGQNVRDVLQYTSIDNAVGALELIAQARHIAPTAPDTLGCYPFSMTDPLLIQDTNGGFPHVLFCGNQSTTESRWVSDGKTRVISAADFAVSPSVILVNINNLGETRIVNFDVSATL